MVSNRRGLRLTPVQRAILTTILYSDIFSFPLTKDELWRFLISDKKILHREFDSSLGNVHSLTSKDEYFCLKGKEQIITQRKKNLSEVSKKVEIAYHVAKKLSIIPSILFIGISGGLAAGNAKTSDDIDFVIITKKNTLFTTRLLILIMLELLGVRRARTQKKTANTICLNLLFDETMIGWFKNSQDVYTAREIAQILPLFGRESMYHRFMKENDWITDFLPNAYSLSSLQKQGSGDSRFHRNDNEGGLFKSLFLNPFIENALRFLQMSFIKRHQTKEIVTKSMLAFHPNDYRTFVLKGLRLKMRQFGLLTKF